MAEDGDDPTSPLRRTEVERPVPTTDSPALPLRSGMVLGGRYEIGKTIGQGGMGLVVQAFDRTLGVEVAIKIVRAEYAGERAWSERLAREVKLARQIQHPNVCRVFDYAQDDGRAFLIMELATGGTLRDEIRARTTGTRPLSARIADARAIAAGLGAIHAAGIVHRDISPQNALRMSDGRLVLSDFGLATDSFDGTTSIHGGTVAYMAPEVARGGGASFSADIWALGAVIYEIVFGERLQWNPERGEMRSSVAGRRLNRTERGVLEICRACLAQNPVRRPRDAAEIAARLSEAELARSAARRRRRHAATVTAAAFVIAAVAVGGHRVKTTARRRAAQVTASTSVDPLMIVPSGEPDDWTEESAVLVELPDRIRCMVQLPNHHTVRFVWDYPRQAEDLDTRTGLLTPSPLVPAAFAEGCPDVSRDGEKLVYTGHTLDDRAYAFVSTHPDGRDASPEVPTAEPTASSDPVWLPDGQTFSYDIDGSHVGVFSLATKRSEVVPATSAPIFTTNHAVIGDRIFVCSIVDSEATDVGGFSFPRLKEVVHFRLPMPMLNVNSPNGNDYYGAVMFGDHWVVARVEPSSGLGHLVGEVRSQSLRTPLFVEQGAVLISVGRSERLILGSSGTGAAVPIDSDIVWASQCGRRIIAEEAKNGSVRTVWLDSKGGIDDTFAGGEGTMTPICSSDGSVRFLASVGADASIRRCDAAGCRRIFEGSSGWLALSRDDSRLAFLSSDNQGHVIRWIPADGHGGGREIAGVDTECAPAWSNEKDLWVALRKGRKVMWTEFDTDSAVPTGRTSPGTSDCTDGVADPASPGKAGTRIEATFRTQIRLLPEKHLSGKK